MVNTIKKLGELAHVIEEDRNINLDVYEYAAIASAFDDVDAAIYAFEEYGYYHFSDIFVWGNESDFEKKKGEIFECCAGCVLDWRWHSIINDEEGDTVLDGKGCSYFEEGYKKSISIVIATMNAIFNTCNGHIIDKLRESFIKTYELFCNNESRECVVLNVKHNDKNYTIINFDKR